MLDAIRAAGAAYLAWLGLQSLIRALRPRPSRISAPSDPVPPRAPAQLHRRPHGEPAEPGHHQLLRGGGADVHATVTAARLFRVAGGIPCLDGPCVPLGWAYAFHTLRQIFAMPGVQRTLEAADGRRDAVVIVAGAEPALAWPEGDSGFYSPPATLRPCLRMCSMRLKLCRETNPSSSSPISTARWPSSTPIPRRRCHRDPSRGLRDIAAQGLTFAGIVSGRRVADLRRGCRCRRTGIHGRPARHGNRDRPSPLAASRSRDGARPRAGTDSAARRSAAIGSPARCIEDKRVSVAVHARAVAYDCRAEALALADAVRRALAGQRKTPAARQASCVARVPAEHRVSQGRRGGVDRQRRRGENRAAAAWVVFLGDDETDEDAFRAIDRGLGILVGIAADVRDASA